MRRAVLILTSLAVVTSACAVRTIPLDPDVTFGAHQESRKFVVDRPIAGKPALVTPATWIRLPGGAAWALRHDGDTLAGYWLDGNAGTIARAGIAVSDRPLGAVRPSWDDNAIRLRIEPPDGPPIQSDVFARTSPGGATPALSRNALSILDVRGRFQATLRDQAGHEVGWLRLRIGPYDPAPRIYEGVLPAGISEELAVATAVSLSTEIDWIEAHTLNVYQGDRGPLMQSIPIH